MPKRCLVFVFCLAAMISRAGFADMDVGNPLFDLETLSLDSLSKRYPAVSSESSTGYFPIAEDVLLEEFEQPQKMPYVPNYREHEFNLVPSFNSANQAYGIAFKVENRTDNDDWVLHLSDFESERIIVWLKTEFGVSQIAVDAGRQELGNALGRAIALNLPSGQQVEIVLQQYSTQYGCLSYIGLMSAEEYRRWSSRIDFLYELAIGIVLGLSLIGLLCWLMLKESIFFWASLSALSITGFYLEHGYLFEYFFQAKRLRGDYYWLLVSISSLSMLAFAGSFIQVNKGSKILRMAFYGIGVIFTVLPGVVFYLSFLTKAILYSFASNLLIATILVSALVKIRSSGRYYLIYFVGWLPLFFIAVHSGLYYFTDVLATDEVPLTYRLIWELYLHILHVFIHIIAVVYRVRMMRLEKVKAEQLSSAKSLYMAHSSHDLHQPIYCMNLYADALRPFLKQPQAVEILDKLQASQGAMSRSLQQIMDLNRLEAGVIKPQVRSVALQSIFNEVQGELAILAQEKGLKLRFRATNRWVQTDPDLLLRMVKNLLSNAIRYTEKGGVLVGCRHRAGAIELQVIDTGQGMSDDAIAQVFDIYQRVSSGEQDGAGIGLSIVKHLAELLNHPIRVSSRLGRGSCFSLRLPLAEKPVNRQPLAKPDTIALVCPEADQHYLTDYFMAQGFAVESFASVSAAVAGGGNQISMLVCHASLLTEPELELISQTESLKNSTLVAIDADSLPSHWLQLRSAMNPIQLRALLNFHQRKVNH